MTKSLQDTIIIIITILFFIYIIHYLYMVNKSNNTSHFTNTAGGFTVDAVITYVDGSDPIWLAEKQKFPKNPDETANSRNIWRWETNGEAKQCIKLIKRNAPFFRKIFLVMSGPSQIPKWLDEVRKIEPKIPIEVMYHHQFYKSKQDLPTYNSLSIEANMHRIPGLSEYFVYFNDDCFISNKVSVSDFIDPANGKLLIQLEDEASAKRGTPGVAEIGFFSAWKNTHKMLDTLFPLSAKENRKMIRHIPQIQRKSTHAKLHELFPKNFETTSSSKFRNTKCNLSSAGFAEYYELYTGTGRPYKNTYVQAFISNDTNRNKGFLDKFKTKKPQFLNIQNTVTNNELAKKQLRDFINLLG